MKNKLHDRINCVINIPAFEEELERQGYCLFDFQLAWPEAAQFEALPREFQRAILVAEAELSKDTVVLA